MPIYDYECENCGIQDMVICKISELPDGPETCEICKGNWRRVIRTARSGGVKRDYASETAALQHSLKERFVKKEIDDVRHKHGVAFDDSLRGAAVDRIKSGQ